MIIIIVGFLTVTTLHFAWPVFEWRSFAICSCFIRCTGIKTISRTSLLTDSASDGTRWPVGPTAPFTFASVRVTRLTLVGLSWKRNNLNKSKCIQKMRNFLHSNSNLRNLRFCFRRLSFFLGFHLRNLYYMMTKVTIRTKNRHRLRYELKLIFR